MGLLRYAGLGILFLLIYMLVLRPVKNQVLATLTPEMTQVEHVVPRRFDHHLRGHGLRYLSRLRGFVGCRGPAGPGRDRASDPRVDENADRDCGSDRAARDGTPDGAVGSANDGHDAG